MTDVSLTPMFIKAVSPPVKDKVGAYAIGSPRAMRRSSGSDCALPAASPIMLRLRIFIGVAGGGEEGISTTIPSCGEEGSSTIGDDEEAAAMACVARAIDLYG